MIAPDGALMARVEGLRERALANAAHWEAERRYPVGAMRIAGEEGLTGMKVAVGQGGLGLSAAETAGVLEYLARHDMAFTFALNSHASFTADLARSGTGEQRERYLQDMLAGRMIGLVPADGARRRQRCRFHHHACTASWRRVADRRREGMGYQWRGGEPAEGVRPDRSGPRLARHCRLSGGGGHAGRGTSSSLRHHGRPCDRCMRHTILRSGCRGRSHAPCAGQSLQGCVVGN